MRISFGRFSAELTAAGGGSLFVRTGTREVAIERSAYRPAAPVGIELWRASSSALHVFFAGWRILCCPAAPAVPRRGATA